MAFTEKQKTLVKEAWEEMKPNVEDLGALYFTKIFENEPSLKDRFSCLKETSARSLSSPVDHPRIKCHAADVFKMICESAVHLCDNDKLQHEPSTLRRLGRAHHKNNVIETDFPVYATSMDETLKERFTDDLGVALKDAHAKLIKAMTDAQAHSKLIKDTEDAIAELKASYQ